LGRTKSIKKEEK